MKVIVIGLGVQGYKRKKFAGEDFVATVDPVNEEADFKDIKDVPLESYDAALCCLPDAPKVEILTYLLGNAKHVLVEKPMWAENDNEIKALEELAQKNNVICYTAYNHRFEPHYMAMRDILKSGNLGKIYRCRMFYGNGTARLVRNSAWRDHGSGVLHDLGSHLLDTLRFWFDDVGEDFNVITSKCHENLAPDHVIIGSNTSEPQIECEMTLLQWRNHFTCDILAENGTAHIESLCKWGPTTLTVRTRILPSGRPPEEATTLIQEDPTWESEYKYFKKMCQSGQKTDMSDDIWLNKMLRELGDEAIKMGKK